MARHRVTRYHQASKSPRALIVERLRAIRKRQSEMLDKEVVEEMHYSTNEFLARLRERLQQGKSL